MRIKDYFIVILFLGAFLQAKATGLSGDIISFNGKKWVLMAKPIEMDSMLYKRLMDFLPDNRRSSTRNWDGYTAFWKIQGGYLCVQRMEVYRYDKTSGKDSTLIYGTEALQIPFAPYYEHGKIQARWVSGELRAGKGDLVWYVHTGFYRNMETERVLHITNGKVMKTVTFHNYKKPGLKMENAQNEIIRRFPWERFPEYKDQRLFFLASNFQVTADGHLKDCYIHSIFLRPALKRIEDDNHPLAIAFKEVLKSIYPWEILFINGKYTMGYTNYTIVIGEKL